MSNTDIQFIIIITDDRSNDASIMAVWKKELEASGPTRIDRPLSDPEEGSMWEDLGGKLWTTPKSMNLGLSLLVIYEKVGTDRQCSM